ncbi:hypothetical protein GJW-30_1_02591 [Variibacter gotjawalensis]|uniref:Uncharacterized protein n=1 Tax=Variibacter gotjawalensis TaxID=1333996 RepID=A0A0S3PVT6_9BRAD|nr:hypothetical protein [Variibacter gotjawalensis]NIK45879.1 hypothetical protein [Variibacter gotjawalensis]RZS47802.1 hypothetical protein EV661_0195 [Variibacter gotjawalensis]BAT60056.1 hypothetical protein GJW-30_1_02591 [Variibacter gotjawalensis]
MLSHIFRLFSPRPTADAVATPIAVEPVPPAVRIAVSVHKPVGPHPLQPISEQAQQALARLAILRSDLITTLKAPPQ